MEEQPLAIALLTSQGIPMLWEGEEICDDYNLPDEGAARINLWRAMNWQYFYDRFGKSLVRVYRRAGQLRRTTRALRSRESFYYNLQSLQGTELVAYHRHAPADAAHAEQYAMVVLNFAQTPASIDVPFPEGGLLDGAARRGPPGLDDRRGGSGRGSLHRRAAELRVDLRVVRTPGAGVRSSFTPPAGGSRRTR